MIKGHSDFPLPEESVEALDNVTKSFKCNEWYLNEMLALSADEGTKTGIQISLQMLHPVRPGNPVGFKPKGKKRGK